MDGADRRKESARSGSRDARGSSAPCAFAAGCCARVSRCRAPALADFPYTAPARRATDYADLCLTRPGRPTTSAATTNEFKYAATPDPSNSVDQHRPTELGGVRGGHVVDATDAPATAWETTTGRPDVTIAVLDSGIKWNDAGAMNDLRFKTRLNRGELPVPQREPAPPR